MGCSSKLIITNFHPDLQSQAAPAASSTNKPTVIGLYGISGCGKTTLLEQVKQRLGEEYFHFEDGSGRLNKLVPGGIDAFQTLNELAKSRYRKQAIEAIGQECAHTGRIGMVAGHLLLREQGGPQSVWTHSDENIYTHMFYLDVSPEVVEERRKKDTKERKHVELEDLRKWQEEEKTALGNLCYKHSILFSTVVDPPLEPALELIRDFQLHSEKHNLALAEQRLDAAVALNLPRLQTMLVLDGDKTLAPQDTGKIFWKLHRGIPLTEHNDKDPLKPLFGGRNYTYTAFRQAMLLYEEACDDSEYDTLCDKVASNVTMYPEFASLLQLVAEHKHVGAIVVTAGLRRVWEKVLKREGLSDTVTVIGGGRLSDGFIVNAEVKGALVRRLKAHHQKKVWAFGDGPLDLEMLKAADRAIVVVGEENAMSKEMETPLEMAIDDNARPWQFCQVLFPATVKERLKRKKLPVIQLTSEDFVNDIFGHSQHPTLATFVYAKENAAKVLMTPMRNKDIEGPGLREAHRRVGWYLATEYLSESNIIGLEEYSMPHVKDTTTTGYRVRHESKTTIVALMRAGEPMAYGVSDALPTAMFLHANDPTDLKPKHVQNQHTIVLVDSVINSGKTIIEFLKHIRSLHATIRIVVVVGVVQEEVVADGKLDGYLNVKVVALRVSKNKYIGTGGNDTGNRLFNTTQLE